MGQADTGRWQRMAAWLIVAGLVLIAGLLALAAYRVDSRLPDWRIFAALFAVQALTLSVPLQLEVRRQGVRMSAGEIPFILALFYLPPLWVIIMRGAVAIAVAAYRVASRRTVPLKALFNVANSGVAGAAAVLVAHSLGIGAAADPATWLHLLTAVLVSQLLVHLAMIAIIFVTEGRRGLEDLIHAMWFSLVVGGINVVLGIMVLITVSTTAAAIIPLIILLALVFAAYRAYSNLLRQRRSLTDLNDFTQSVAQAVQSNRLVDIMTHQLRAMLYAEAATVWVPNDGRFPELLLTAYLDTEGLLDDTPVPEELRKYVVETGESLLITANSGRVEHRELIASQQVKDVILVPLRSGSVAYGCLAVANRLGGDNARFGSDELTMLETLAAHAGVAVENSRLVDRLRFDVYHDALTELPNRRRSMDVLAESISITVPGEIVSIMLFDVDGMRDINDSIGHSAGDQLIVEVGRRLRNAAPESAHVGRIDGDEFAVVVRLPDTADALELAEEIRTALQQPCRLGNINIDIDAAVGIAVHPESGDKAGALLQRADVATQTAKNVSSGIQVYNAGLESDSVRRLGLASDLRRAFNSGELYVHYQPKISLADRRVIGMECLARWKHPTHGEVPPEDFVPVAEHTGLMGRLTEFVLRDGLNRSRELTSEGYDIGVAVNLSPRTLGDADFPDLVKSLLDEYEVAAEKLTLEITEDGMVSASGRTSFTLQRLREIGVHLAVDDFGKGYSSLSYLRNLPAQEIKIDRSFVQGMATAEGDLAIVRAVVDLARHFDMRVVAEGVESEMTLSLLTEMGCDIAQGFYFSRPLSSDRLGAWMAAQSADPGSAKTTSPKLRAV